MDLTLTIITRVNPLSQEEAAKLVLSMFGVLYLHQVGRHAKWIVLQVALTLLTSTEKLTEELNQTKQIKGWLFIHKHSLSIKAYRFWNSTL